LNVKHGMFAITRIGDKTTELPVTADSLLCKPLCQCSESHCFDCRFDLSALTCLYNLRLVIEPQIQGWQTSRRVAQGFNLCNTSTQDK